MIGRAQTARTAALAALPVLTACAASAPVPGLSRRGPAAPPGLGYEVEIAGSRLVSVELTVAFHLAVRELEAGDPAGRAEKRIRIGPAEWDVHDLEVGPAGAYAWIASADGRVRAFDLASGEAALTWRLGAAATAVAVSGDGAYVATGSQTGVVCLRRARDGALLQCVAAHGGPVSALDFSRAELASSSWDGTARIWEVPSLAVAGRYARRGSINDVAFSPDGARIAIAGSRAPPRRDPATEARERTVGYGRVDPQATVEVWTPGAGAKRLGCHAGPVTAVAWTGERVLSASWDRTIRLWRRGGGEAARLGGFPHLVRDVAARPGGRLAVAATWSPEGRRPALVRLGLPGADAGALD